MNQTLEQPVTHSLLRQSQRRRQSISQMQQQNASPLHQSHLISKPIQQNSKQKYHFNYSRSKPQSSQKKGISSSLYESKYLSNNQASEVNKMNQSMNVNVRQSLIIPATQQKIVVCQSLPKTRPKYSFTFSNMPPHSSTFIPHNTTQTPRASINNQQQQNVPHISSQRSKNVRQDIDLCLYAINDRLKEMQSHETETKNFIQSKFSQDHQSNQSSAYKPSISQIRKNKKMYLDKSIHRIHPEIVNEYIETVYRDYDIPDPLKSGERVNGSGERQYRQRKHVEITQFELKEKQVQKEKISQIEQKKENKTQPLNRPHIQTNNINHQKSTIIQQQQIPSTEPLQYFQKVLTQPYFLHNTKFPSQNNRKNNLISQNQPQRNKKKTFLNLTLSKEKPIKSKTFESPSVRPNQKLQQKNSERQEESSLSKSSKSKSRHSSSQKKIMEIKKNIATWNDSEHQYAQRYSYLESPYQIIRHSKTEYNKERQTQSIPSQKGNQINIKVRPFEQLMKATAPTQANQHLSTGYNQSITHQSQFLQSKYIQSTFTHEGEILQEFRFCLLCELPVLSANISKHQEKCIGWIDEKGKLIRFGQLYRIESEQELKDVVKGKIKEIKKRITKKITELKEREKHDPNQKNKLTTNILQSVEQLVQNFTMITDFDQLSPQNSSLFSSGYRKIQQNYRSQYLLLLEDSKKLHWFVKLLENYQKRLKKLNTSQQVANRQKHFSSTKAKHNQSLTFIEQEQSNNQVVSEFGSQKEHQLQKQKQKQRV